MSGKEQAGENAPDFSFLSGDQPETDETVEFVPQPKIDTTKSAAPIQPKNPKSQAKKLQRRKSTSETGASDSNKEDLPTQKKKPRKVKAPVAKSAGDTNPEVSITANEDSVPRKTFHLVLGYAAALTLLVLYLLLTGRLSGTHQLESLPDIRPLQEGEFQLVPHSVSLPRNHTLQIGESRQFGDVILTAEKVTFEPLQFCHMTSGKEAVDMQTQPVLKLWLRMENASAVVSFPPWDIGLMCHRSQRGSEIATDESVVTNSWLMLTKAGDEVGSRVLNFQHPAESSFDLLNQNSGKTIAPGESMTTYVASSNLNVPPLKETTLDCTWRIQIRKGVNQASGNAVTTLVEVKFTSEQITPTTGA